MNENYEAVPQTINGEQVYVLQPNRSGTAPNQVPPAPAAPNKGRKVGTVFLTLIPWVILQVVQTVVLLFVFFIKAGNVIAEMVDRGRLRDPQPLYDALADAVGPTMLIYGIISAIGFGIFYMVKYVDFKEAGKNICNVGWRFWLAAFIAVIGAQTFAQGLVYCIQGIPAIENFMDQLYSNNPVYEAMNTDNMSAGMLIALVIFVPIAEELVFRGIAGGMLKKVGHTAKFILIFTALFFAIAHGNVLQIIYVAVLGFSEGYMYVKKGTIVPTIAMHMLYNLLGSSVVVARFVESLPYPTYFFLIIGGLGAVAGAFFLARSEKKKEIPVDATNAVS